MNEPTLKLGDFDFQVKTITATVPVSCCMAADYGLGPACNHPTPPRASRRRRLKWWMADRWDRRPRVHLGPCNHDDCC